MQLHKQKLQASRNSEETIPSNKSAPRIAKRVGPGGGRMGSEIGHPNPNPDRESRRPPSSEKPAPLWKPEDDSQLDLARPQNMDGAQTGSDIGLHPQMYPSDSRPSLDLEARCNHSGSRNILPSRESQQDFCNSQARDPLPRNTEQWEVKTVKGRLNSAASKNNLSTSIKSLESRRFLLGNDLQHLNDFIGTNGNSLHSRQASQSEAIAESDRSLGPPEGTLDCTCPACMSEPDYVLRKMAFKSYLDRIKITPQIFESLRKIRFCETCHKPDLRHIDKSEYMVKQADLPIKPLNKAEEVQKKEGQFRPRGDEEVCGSRIPSPIVSESENDNLQEVKFERFGNDNEEFAPKLIKGSKSYGSIPQCLEKGEFIASENNSLFQTVKKFKSKPSNFVLAENNNNSIKKYQFEKTVKHKKINSDENSNVFEDINVYVDEGIQRDSSRHSVDENGTFNKFGSDEEFNNKDNKVIKDLIQEKLETNSLSGGLSNYVHEKINQDDEQFNQLSNFIKKIESNDFSR